MVLQFLLERREMINTRLSEISRGDYREIIERVDEQERPRQTVCVGVNWVYERKDLLEVAEVT